MNSKINIKFFNDYNINPEQVESSNWTAANGFCFDEKGRVAIVWEKEKNYWTLPGGGKENNETPEQTFIREVKEEVQADVDLESIKYFHAVYARFYDDFGNKVNAANGTRDEKLQQICFRFICKLKNISEFVPNKNENNFVSEIDERKFVTIEELPKYITWLEDSENGKESFEILKKMLN